MLGVSRMDHGEENENDDEDNHKTIEEDNTGDLSTTASIKTVSGECQGMIH